MKVADLQQHLDDLARFLRASGARSVADELATIQSGLNPFRDTILKDFADFLVRAEGFSRGEVPIKSGKIGKSGSRTKVKIEPPDIGPLAREVRYLYDRAADPSVTTDQIEEIFQRLSGLSKTALVIVAEAIELKGMKSKKLDVIRETIRNRILSRKGSSQRAGMINPLGTQDQ